MNYELLTTENAPVKMWTKGVPVEADARQQLINTVVQGCPVTSFECRL